MLLACLKALGQIPRCFLFFPVTGCCRAFCALPAPQQLPELPGCSQQAWMGLPGQTQPLEHL